MIQVEKAPKADVAIPRPQWLGASQYPTSAEKRCTSPFGLMPIPPTTWSSTVIARSVIGSWAEAISIHAFASAAVYG